MSGNGKKMAWPAPKRRPMNSETRKVCIDLVLRYENDPVILAMVENMRAGYVRPSKIIVCFSCN